MILAWGTLFAIRSTMASLVIYCGVTFPQTWSGPASEKCSLRNASKPRPKYSSLLKNGASFPAGMAIAGWWYRYSWIAVVPDFCAPTTRKSNPLSTVALAVLVIRFMAISFNANRLPDRGSISNDECEEGGRAQPHGDRERAAFAR